MPILLFILGWVLYFFFVWRDMFTIEGSTIMAKSANVWGDWAMHFTQTSQFVHRSLVPGDHPLLEGAPYAYPFAINWITAVLVRAGTDFFQAHILTSYILSILLVVIMIVLAYRVLESKGAAVVAGLIFFLNGGLGFIWNIAERLQLITPISDFHGEITLISSLGIRWINMITSMMIPQRAFSLGFPVGVLALLIVIQQIKKHSTKWRLRSFFVAGLLAGLLPILHMHSYLGSAILFGWYGLWSLFRNRRTIPGIKKVVLAWLLVLIPAVVIPTPLFLTQYSDTLEKTSQGTFMQWYPGWFTNAASDYPEMSIVWFWLVNWGVVLPLAMIGFFLVKPVQRGILLPFFILFGVSNLFLFQPFVWDNTKILIWSSVGLSMFAAIPIWKMLIHRRFLIQLIGGLILIVAILSGTHDAVRMVHPDSARFGMYDLADLALAKDLRDQSEPDDSIIAAPQHNNPFINFSGRNILLGYKGWLWTYGLNYFAIENDIRQILSGGDRAEELLNTYNVKFVIIDPDLKREWKTDTAFFEERFPVEHQDQFRVIYRVR